MMNKSLLNAIGLLILRVSIGLFMIVGHGWTKLMGFSEMAEKFPDPLGMGNQLSLIATIGSEVGCSLLLVLGLATRIAAVPLAFTMIVALFIVHGADPWKTKELAAIYLAAYVTLIFTGGGCFSADHCIWSRKRSDDPE